MTTPAIPKKPNVLTGHEAVEKLKESQRAQHLDELSGMTRDPSRSALLLSDLRSVMEWPVELRCREREEWTAEDINEIVRDVHEMHKAMQGFVEQVRRRLQRDDRSGERGSGL